MDTEKSVHMLHIPTWNLINRMEEPLPYKVAWLLLFVIGFTIILSDQLYSNKPIILGPVHILVLIIVAFLIIYYVFCISVELTPMCVQYIRRFRGLNK